MRTVIAATALALAITGPPFAAPQTPVGRFEGTVKGSLASRPVSAAQVSLVRLESDTSINVSVRVDARGRFSVDSLPAGHYLVQVNHPTLDSLDVALPTNRLVIANGRTSHSDLTLPSGASLRDVVCTGVTLSAEQAVVAGHILDADSDVPIAGAKIVVEWNDITIDRKSRRVATLRRMAIVSAGRLGEYRLCGVPAELPLSIQVQHADRAGAAIQLRVTAEEGVVVRDFSLSLRSAATIAAFDSLEGRAGKLRVDSTSTAIASTGDADATASAQAPGAATSAELTLSGSAMITGTVNSASGQPVEGAEVRVRDAHSTTVTDKSGRFVLNGLPSGTQVLLVRRLGYGLAEIPVELRSDVRTRKDVHLPRAVALDSVRVVAAKWSLADFERNRKTNLQGRFLTLSEIQQSHAKKTSDLLPLLGGPTMIGRGRREKLQETNYDPPGSHSCKSANVVINGVEGQAVDDVVPNQIAGIEIYNDAAAAPLQYAGRANCGVIVIWLRPGPRWHGWRAFFTGTRKDD
jgi:hypothetical protein